MQIARLTPRSPGKNSIACNRMEYDWRDYLSIPLRNPLSCKSCRITRKLVAWDGTVLSAFFPQTLKSPDKSVQCCTGVAFNWIIFRKNPIACEIFRGGMCFERAQCFPTFSLWKYRRKKMFTRKFNIKSSGRDKSRLVDIIKFIKV